MTSSFLQAATLLTALGCGIVAGVFFAFSNFVMPALGRLPAPAGAAAMQSINITVINPLFMTTLFGTGLAGLALAGWAAFSLGEPGAPFVLAGGLLYLAGTVLVTMIKNVPLNDELAPLAADSADAASVWQRYLRAWTAWNSVRTVAALVAAGMLIAALVDA